MYTKSLILDEEVLSRVMCMLEKERYLLNHPYKLYRDKGGRWYSDIYEWILKSVTCGVPYGGLRASGIPCSRDYFYDRYRKFFWVLDKIR